MADAAHEWTDEQIDALTDRMRQAYDDAASEMAKKLSDFLTDFDSKNAEMKGRLSSGDIDKDTYDKWLEYQSTRQVWIQKMAEELAADATQVDQLAMAYINEELPKVYSENFNYSMYGIETEIGFDTHSFTLYDQKTVALMLADPDAIRYPQAQLDETKDAVWNYKHINGAITQSILQGESIPNAAKRLRKVADMDYRTAARVARTIMTSAENAGRVESYRVADKAGVRVEKQWIATIDMRTRYSHRAMNKVHVPYDQPFIVDGQHKMMHPADPKGPAQEVYNCRCTLVGYVKGIEAEDPEQWSDLPAGITYEKWLKQKENDQSKQLKPKEQPTQKKPQKVSYTHKGSKIWTQLGKADPETVRGKVGGMLEGAAGKAAQLWSKFEGKLTYADPVHTNKSGKPKGAYFTPWSSHGFGVHMNLDFVINDKVMGKLATWFHEFGHNIDYVSEQGNWYTTGKNGHAFGNIIAAEVDEFVQARQKEWSDQLNDLKSKHDLSGILGMGLTKSWAKKYGGYHKTAQEHVDDDAWLTAHKMGYIASMKGTEQRSQAIFDYYSKLAGVPKEKKLKIQTVRDKIGHDITNAGLETQLAIGDIFEGATLGKCQDTYGHGKSYWSKTYSALGKEAFAEFFSAECTYSERPEILDTMKAYLPKSYAAYTQIVEGLLNDD